MGLNLQAQAPSRELVEGFPLSNRAPRSICYTNNAILCMGPSLIRSCEPSELLRAR